MEKEVVYVAELDSDVDDVVAAHYLFNEGVLKCVVCDPYPRTPEGLARKGKLEALGIDVVKKMPPVAKYVFVGGALTAVAGYIRMHHVDWLVMNGGFVGANIATFELDKFKGKNTVRTFNFNCDVVAADTVLKTDEKHISHIVLVGKNVCHDVRNTKNGLWSGEKYKILQYCKDHDISLQDVVFVDDTIPFLREAERKGIKSFHISSFLDWDFERR